MRRLRLTALLILLAVCLPACGARQPEEDRFSIVVTIFPAYDWVLNILGDNPADAEVTLLLDRGVDIHSYQPTVEDLLKVSDCDLFIYVGGESDEWAEDALAEAVNRDMAVINLLELLGDRAKEEETVEGMQAGKEEEPAADEHVWLSLVNAAFYVDRIAEVLAEKDPANAGSYLANAAAYRAELEALDEEYRTAVSEAGVTTLLFGDRFPFRYLTEDYGLAYYAAFPGCSAETEASFETIIFLADKLEELGLPAVLTIEGSDSRIAETIRNNTKSRDQKILVLDSLQALTPRDAADGAGYLSVMKKNLDVLKEALD